MFSLPFLFGIENCIESLQQMKLMNRLIVEAERILMLCKRILMLCKEAQRIGKVTCDIWLEWFTNEKDIDDELRYLGFLTY